MMTWGAFDSPLLVFAGAAVLGAALAWAVRDARRWRRSDRRVDPYRYWRYHISRRGS